MRKIFLLFLILLTSSVLSVKAEWVYTPKDKKWRNPKYSSKGTPRDQFRKAQKYEKKKKYDRAAHEYKKMVKRFPTSKLVPDALFKAATCYEENGSFYKAFQAYQELIEKYPADRDFNNIVERQFKIGNLFLSGKKRKVWKISLFPSSEQAIEVFEQIIKNLPFSDMAIQSQFNIGLVYEKMNLDEDAIEEYTKVINEYPDTSQAIKAYYRIADCYFKLSYGADYDQSSARKSLEYFRRFVLNYPNSDLVDDAGEKILKLEKREAQRTYEVGLYYEKNKEHEAARVYYNDVITNFPDTEYAEKSAERMEKL